MYAVPAAYCGDAQLPPFTELDEALDKMEELDRTLDNELLEEIIDERDDDEGTVELIDDDVTPSHTPNNVHSCHWPE